MVGAVVVGNALTFYFLERGSQAGLTVIDSFWYSLVSITTIGYGDYAATTIGARIGAVVFVMVIGLATFTTLVGMMVDWIIEFQIKERSGMSTVGARGHLVVVNFPNELRVRQIVDEFTHDSHHRDREIAIVTDKIDSLPFVLPHVSFVRGSPLEEETYRRAGLESAQQVIVLSTGFDDPNSDSVVASVVSVVQHLNPDIDIVAECLNRQHSLLFSSPKRLSLVYTMRVAYNLLVQEAQDPGVNLLAQAITSNEIEGTLSSSRVDGDAGDALPYTQIAKTLLDHNINLLGVVRDGDVIVNFGDARLSSDDLLVYISSSRLTWAELGALLDR